MKKNNYNSVENYIKNKQILNEVKLSLKDLSKNLLNKPEEDLSKYTGNYKYINPHSIKSSAIGGGIGAAAGAFGSAGNWAIKRKKLREELKNCGNDSECIKNVNKKISSFNKKSLIKGLGIMLAGGTVGALPSGYISAIRGLYDTQTTNVDREKLAKETLEKRQELNDKFMLAWELAHPDKHPEHSIPGATPEEIDRRSYNMQLDADKAAAAAMTIGRKNLYLGIKLNNKYGYDHIDDFHVLNPKYSPKI